MQTEIIVNYSYPTSNNARKANLYKEGCYSVEIVKMLKSGQSLPNFIAGFRTAVEAHKYASDLNLPYNKYSLQP